jgi:D-aspartate ligase
MEAERFTIRNPAVVLDLGVNGLGIIRSLGRKGVDVTGVVYIDSGVVVHSRYCKVARMADVSAGDPAFLSGLLDLCRSMSAPPVIYAANDIALAFISNHEEELASAALFVLPPRQTMLDVLNKDRTRKIAEDCGVRIPPTYTVSSCDELCELGPRMRYPILYKPRNHYEVLLPENAKNYTFRDPNEMAAFFREYPRFACEGVFQEIIWGGDGHILVCAVYLDRDSEPLAVYTGRKIRQLEPDYGVTSFGVSENIPRIAETTTQFLKQIGFRGLAALEYVEDRATGEIYFIEINARSYYHNSLFHDVGINLPWIAYLDAVRHPMLAREVMPRQTYGRKWVDFARDARSFRKKHKAGQLGWIPWVRSLLEARSFAVLAADDPGPFVFGMAKLIWRQFKKAGKRVRGRIGRRHAPACGPVIAPHG